MTIHGTPSILQVKSGAGATITVTVNAGSYLDVYAVTTPYTANVTSISDTVDTYLAEQRVPDTSFNWTADHYITGPIAASGAKTLTFTFQGSPTTTDSLVVEIGNSVGYLTSTGQLQSSGDTGQDAVTSGVLGVLAAPRALVAGVCATYSGTTDTIGGSGFTDLGYFTSGSARFFRVENKMVYSTASIAATFTLLGAATHRITFASAWAAANSPTRIYANGQFFSNTFIEGGTQLGGGLIMKTYANGNTQILSMVETATLPARLYANGTFVSNGFSEI